MSISNRYSTLSFLNAANTQALSPNTVTNPCNSPTEPFDRIELAKSFSQYARYFDFKAKSKNEDKFFSESELDTAANLAVSLKKMARSLYSPENPADKLNLLYLLYSSISPLKNSDMKSFDDFKKSFENSKTFRKYIVLTTPNLVKNLSAILENASGDIPRFKKLLESTQEKWKFLLANRNALTLAQRLDFTTELTDQINAIQIILDPPVEMKTPQLLENFTAYTNSLTMRFNSINETTQETLLDYIESTSIIGNNCVVSDSCLRTAGYYSNSNVPEDSRASAKATNQFK
jgi:hypothetical protein